MSGLLDVLQSASNAVAGNVSGPVDLISFLLRKAGVKVPEDAVGSSEWMKRRGLTREVPQGAAQVAGETLGLLAPTVMAAKAPQIASGLLQMQANAAAPRTLRPDAGAIVWHGSPHKFDRFDSSKIGTGEGAQAYGHGLYLADNPSVASYYKKAGVQDSWTDDVPRMTEAVYRALGPMPDGRVLVGPNRSALTKEKLAAQIAQDPAAVWQTLPSGVQKKALEVLEPPGALYKVDLPDDKIARMLDWDKPMSQQSAAIREAFEPLVAPMRQVEAGTSGAGWGDLAAPRSYDPTGRELLQLLAQKNQPMTADTVLSGGLGPEVAVKARQMSIPGIRYLDGGSRGAGAGTSNYVIFPGEEGLLKILERNGVPLP